MSESYQSHVIAQMNTLSSWIKSYVNRWSLTFEIGFYTITFNKFLVAYIVKQISTLKCFEWLHFYNNNINLKLKHKNMLRSILKNR